MFCSTGLSKFSLALSRSIHISLIRKNDIKDDKLTEKKQPTWHTYTVYDTPIRTNFLATIYLIDSITAPSLSDVRDRPLSLPPSLSLSFAHWVIKIGGACCVFACADHSDVVNILGEMFILFEIIVIPDLHINNAC